MQAKYDYETRRWVSGHRSSTSTKPSRWTRPSTTAPVYGGVGLRRREPVSEIGQNFWIQRVNPFVFTKFARDRVEDGDEVFVNSGLRFHYAAGLRELLHGLGREPWRGRRFDAGHTRRLRAAAGAALAESLRRIQRRPIGVLRPRGPVQGDERFISSGFTLQPNQNLTQSIDYRNVRFRASINRRAKSSTSTSSIRGRRISSTGISW